MKKPLYDQYNSEFYEYVHESSTPSAEIVLDIVFTMIYKPQSIIDIGCGCGAWLKVAETLGVQELKGLDGDWVKKENLLSENIDFTTVDLEKNFRLKKKYDLCMSLEVAEHLSEHRAESFVKNLCDTSDVVLFSAAIKHQGGANHINEQMQSYWIRIFNSYGYECLDIVRPSIWGNDRVNTWYQQNAFLFVNTESKLLNINDLRLLAKPIADIVHPIHYESVFNQYEKKIMNPTFYFMMFCLKRFVLVSLSHLKQFILRFRNKLAITVNVHHR